MKPIVVGIAGGTGSGKSTLANSIKKFFGDKAIFICHDNYYKSNDHLAFEERVKINYDHPDAFETDLLVTHLEKLLNGETIEMPKYSFVKHLRENETTVVEPRKLIIVEGILALESPKLREFMDMKIFVDTDADVRFIRRVSRDLKERGRDFDSVVNQYLTTVKPMHEQFCEPSKKYADIIVPEGGRNTVAVEMIIDRLKALV